MYHKYPEHKPEIEESFYETTYSKDVIVCYETPEFGKQYCMGYLLTANWDDEIRETWKISGRDSYDVPGRILGWCEIPKMEE